jgi:hypothetical protein
MSYVQPAIPSGLWSKKVEPFINKDNALGSGTKVVIKAILEYYDKHRGDLE